MKYQKGMFITMRLNDNDINEIKNGYIVSVRIDGIDYRIMKQYKE